MSSDKVHLFQVDMTCEGCSNAVTRVLEKHKEQGVENFNVDLVKKTVNITSKLPSSDLLAIIKKTGKKVTYIGEETSGN